MVLANIEVGDRLTWVGPVSRKLWKCIVTELGIGGYITISRFGPYEYKSSHNDTRFFDQLLIDTVDENIHRGWKELKFIVRNKRGS